MGLPAGGHITMGAALKKDEKEEAEGIEEEKGDRFSTAINSIL